MSRSTKPAALTITTRKAWGAAPATGMADQAPPEEAFLHYSDSADVSLIHTRAQAYAAARGIQHFHQAGRGWSDIAYHYLLIQVEPPSRSASVTSATADWASTPTLVLAGRSPRKVPAAQGGHNTRTLAICVHANPLTPITRRTVYAIEWLLMKHRSVLTLGAHGDVTSTDCPGRILRAEIPRIAAATGVGVYPKRRA